MPDENKQLFWQVDTDGLYLPTAFTYSMITFSTQFYTAINADTTVKRNLLKSSIPWANFTLATTNVLKVQDHANLVIQKCPSGHMNFELIVKAARCFAKNDLKRLNTAKDAPASLLCNRKLRKLTSKDSNKV